MKADNLNLRLEVNDTYASKEVPNNIEAEQGVLGAILNNNELLHKVGDFLLPDHFYMPLHQKIYENIIRLVERGMVANPITMKNLFEKDEVIIASNSSSFDYLARLAANATSVINIISFAKTVFDLSIRRKLILIGQDVIQDSYEEKSEEEAHNKIERAEQKLFDLAVSGSSDSKLLTIKESIKQMLARLDTTIKRGGKFSGVSTGLIELDRLLGGFQNSDLLIIAARPSMGKTALAINLGLNAAEFFVETAKKENKAKPLSVGIFSLEMSSEQLVTRMLSIKTKINSGKIRLGNIKKEEFMVLSKESANLNELPIFIDDTPALSISALRTRARRLKRQHNLGLLLVDYLQLLTSLSYGDNRVNEIGNISQGLKAIAKELDIPVIALSQLSRAVETREDKRPQLSDLRESGNIEQDADVVMFIYREEYYLERKKPIDDPEKMLEWQEKHNKVHNTAEILVSKQRNGPIGSALLMFDSETTTFSNLDFHHHEGG